MGVINSSNTIPGTFGPLSNDGVPVAGTNGVYTLTIGGAPTAGAASGLKFSLLGETSDLALWSATNATLLANIQAALNGLDVVGTNGLVAAVGTMTAGVGTITLTAGGNLAKFALSAPTVTNLLTGTGTAAIAETTAGVTATQRGAAKGAKLIDTTNGIDYVNTGTSLSPTWTKTGTQT